jgi:hypothetical protein
VEKPPERRAIPRSMANPDSLIGNRSHGSAHPCRPGARDKRLNRRNLLGRGHLRPRNFPGAARHLPGICGADRLRRQPRHSFLTQKLLRYFIPSFPIQAPRDPVNRRAAILGYRTEVIICPGKQAFDAVRQGDICIGEIFHGGILHLKTRSGANNTPPTRTSCR